MEIQILKDPDVEPNRESLEQALGALYPVYSEFMDALESETYGLSSEWRYYKDGKAWLCKLSRGKKTVVWLSVWEGFFRLGFYFTEKTGEGITALDIREELKTAYTSAKPIGRLRPLVVDVEARSGLGDAFTLVSYKSTVK